MSEKGFDTETAFQTPNFSVTEERPFRPEKSKTLKVDINVLKARAAEIQNKENKKNILIFACSLFILAVIGIYLSS
jgi:hypothetical protein